MHEKPQGSSKAPTASSRTSESSQGVWASTSEVAYMAQQGRAGHPSHAKVLELLQAEYRDQTFSILDCGVMSGVMATDLSQSGLRGEYTGIDISATIIEDCRAQHPASQWLQMGVCDLAFNSDSFDVVHARHLLEHLPYYETAVRELFRVARRTVVICFFQAPRDPEVLLRRDTPGGYLWLNRYAPGPFEALLGSLAMEVKSVETTHKHLTHRIYFCSLP